VQLWGSNVPGSLGTLLGSVGTGTSGSYQLVSNTGYAFYHLVEIDRPDYYSVGAQSPTGTIVNPNWIRIPAPPGGTYPGNNFWDEVTAVTPTPTPTVVPLFFAGYVLLDLPLPEAIVGATVTLYVMQGTTWVPVDTSLSDNSGHFDLIYAGNPASEYRIVETNLPGYQSTRAEVPLEFWEVVSPDEVHTILQGDTVGCVYFWDIWDGPSPTPLPPIP